ncbi:methionine--tRNA ligase [Candidatus Poribacteria bacterium]|nr:MAG: methionine--tRNA ligase [Candidatus Poribacteria bacterium]
MGKFYVTTPIYYVNAPPHIGHAYTTMAADVVARHRRLAGDDVFFLTGTDEHGQNIERIAKEHGMPEQKYCDMIAAEFKRMWGKLNISNDYFIRTTDERHMRAVQKFFRAIYEAGDIYKGHYEGWYCVRCERFYDEDELDEDKNCPIHGLPVEWVKEENYFFALSKYRDRLLKHIEENPDFIQPESRRNEVLSLLEEGLEDVSISRSTVKWGVPVPIDPSQTIYVWMDALCNYISAIGYGDDEETFKRYWPADLHLIGKEILRFHAIMWPAMLMSAGLPLPRRIFAHGWLTKEGKKLSKTTGNIIDIDGLVERFGVDPVRYFFLREFSFGKDGDYTDQAFITRYNADLANDLGNLLNRTLGLARKHFDSVPHPSRPGEHDDEIRDMAIETHRLSAEKLDRLAFDEALETIWNFVRRLNKYIQQTEPWRLAAEEGTRDRAGTIIYNCLEGLRFISVMIYPFMPETSLKIREQIGLRGEMDEDYSSLESWGRLKPGLPLGEPKPLFPRIKVERATPQPTKPKEEAMITIEDFRKLDLRAAKVLEAERVEGTDRLLKLVVDIGTERRQVVAGIAQSYSPEELVGKTLVLVANLKPAKIRGIESQGMILAAESKEGCAVVILDRDIPPGTRVR